MPDLPTLPQSVGDQPGPNVGLPMAATPGALGAGVGQSLGIASEVASKKHFDALQQFNLTSVLDAHNQLQQHLQDSIYDGQKGLIHTNTGKNAPAAVDQAMAGYDQTADKLTQNLANDQQKDQFQRMVMDQRSGLQEHLASYESGQLNTYQQQVSQATVANAGTAAVRNAQLALSDPTATTPEARAAKASQAATQSIQTGIAAMQDEAQRKAEPPEMVQEKTQAYTSAVHYQVMQSMLANGHDQAAQSYYQTHKGDLIGEQADTVARQVDAAGTAGTAVRMAPGMVFDSQGQVRNRADVYADLASNKTLQGNPKLLEATTRQVNTLLDQQQQAKAQHDAQVFDSTYDAMKASPLGIGDPKVQAAMQQLSPQKQQWLQAAGQKGDVPPGSDAYYGLVTQATSPKGREAFVNTDLRQYRGSVNPKDYEHLINMQMRLRGGSGQTGENDPTKGTMTADQIVTNTLSLNGYKTSSTGGVIDPDVARYRREVNDQVQAAGGVQKLGPAGVQKIADALMVQTTVTKTRDPWINPMAWFKGSTYTEPGPRVFQTPQGEPVPPMTPARRAQIIQTFKDKGYANPSDAMISQANAASQAPHASP